MYKLYSSGLGIEYAVSCLSKGRFYGGKYIGKSVRPPRRRLLRLDLAESSQMNKSKGIDLHCTNAATKHS
jgi:hypothetical protein